MFVCSVQSPVTVVFCCLAQGTAANTLSWDVECVRNSFVFAWEVLKRTLQGITEDLGAEEERAEKESQNAHSFLLSEFVGRLSSSPFLEMLAYDRTSQYGSRDWDSGEMR